MHPLLSHCCRYLVRLSLHQQTEHPLSRLTTARRQSSPRTFRIGSRRGRTVRLYWLWVGRRSVIRRGRSIGGSSGNQHGTGCLPHHVFCHTAQEHVGEPRPPMRPHDDEIHPLLTRCVHNRLRRGPLDEKAIALEPSTLHPLQTRLQELLRLGLQAVQSGDRQPGCRISHGQGSKVKHVEQGESCLELLRQSDSIYQGSVCRGAQVNRNEHVLDDHRGLLAYTDRCGT